MLSSFCVKNFLLYFIICINQKFNKCVYLVSSSLGNLSFYEDEDGNKYVVGADSVTPFKSLSTVIYQFANRPSSLTLSDNCVDGYIYGWNGGWNVSSPKFTCTTTAGTLTRVQNYSTGSAQAGALGYAVYRLQNASAGTKLTFGYGSGGDTNKGGVCIVYISD